MKRPRIKYGGVEIVRSSNPETNKEIRSLLKIKKQISAILRKQKEQKLLKRDRIFIDKKVNGIYNITTD